ncbi:MAG: ester cyclase [Chitinophagaceae bacterium]
MKTIQLAYVCFALLLLSCGGDSTKSTVTAEMPSASGLSPAAQRNLDIMHVIDKAFATGDVSAVDSVVADNFVDHTDKGDMNRDSLKAMIKMWHNTDKTMKMETTKEVADDNYAFAMTHISGTGDGVMMPAGPYDMHSVEVVRFSNGKAVEHWGYMEMGEVTKMMAAMAKPTEKMKAPEKKK